MDKIFVNGLISKEVSPTAPDFILGKMSIQVNDLIVWLNQNRKLSDENGWINITILRSKNTGKRYIEVDTWRPEKKQEANETKDEVKTSSYNPENGEVSTDKVPF